MAVVRYAIGRQAAYGTIAPIRLVPTPIILSTGDRKRMHLAELLRC
jgi:hypothetical protein